MAIRSDVIMTPVVIKFSDSIILSQGILFEEYFGCSVCMENILYEDISFSIKKCYNQYKTSKKFGISIIVILCIIFLFDI